VWNMDTLPRKGSLMRPPSVMTAISRAIHRPFLAPNSLQRCSRNLKITKDARHIFSHHRLSQPSRRPHVSLESSSSNAKDCLSILKLLLKWSPRGQTESKWNLMPRFFHSMLSSRNSKKSWARCSSVQATRNRRNSSMCSTFRKWKQPIPSIPRSHLRQQSWSSHFRLP
jgi:hypothetical protein